MNPIDKVSKKEEEEEGDLLSLQKRGIAKGGKIYFVRGASWFQCGWGKGGSRKDEGEKKGIITWSRHDFLQNCSNLLIADNK